MSGRVVVPVVLPVLVAAVVAAGCGGSDGGGEVSGPASSLPATIRVSSSAFGEGAAIPVRYTCAGAGESPPLRWTVAAPAAPQALVVDDPDAPGGTFVHWVVFDLPGSTTGLPSGGALPPGARQAKNSAGRVGWTPPCPPSGTHHYRFTVYAETGPAGLADGTGATDAIAAIQRLASARGQLVGLVTHR